MTLAHSAASRTSTAVLIETPVKARRLPNDAVTKNRVSATNAGRRAAISAVTAINGTPIAICGWPGTTRALATAASSTTAAAPAARSGAQGRRSWYDDIPRRRVPACSPCRLRFGSACAVNLRRLSRSARPPVSVVVPFHGSRDQARTTLAAMAALDLRRDDEVVIADNTREGALLAVTDGRARVVPAPLE